MKNDIKIFINSWFSKNSYGVPKSDIDFFDSDYVDSFKILELIMQCEKKFSINFLPEDFQKEEFKTIDGIAIIIKDRINDRL